MGQDCLLREEDHDSLRRIVGMHDVGEDVRSLQHALNRELRRRRRYPVIRLTWKIITKRLTPTLWGYVWAHGALREFRTHHVNLFKLRKPNPHVHKSPRLKEDGKFGPKTKAALIKYQHKVGLPDDGIAGPEVWEHLFPFWIVKIIVVRDTASGGKSPAPSQDSSPQPQPPAPPEPTPSRKFIGSPFAKATLDNIAGQMGGQIDKNGLTAIFVMQATWKTEEDPDEIVPGHWEHTGGFQVNTPVPIGKPGQTLQAYYQLTRAEVFSIELTEGIELNGDVWVQPTLQAPLDAGTRAKPNLPQAGIAAGGTVSLEFKGDKDRPTVKVFVQGAGVASVDSHGSTDTGGQVVAGVSVEFDADKLFGGSSSSSKSAQGDGMTADPAVVVLKPGGSAQVNLKVTHAPMRDALVAATPAYLPEGVTGNMWDTIKSNTGAGVLHLTAASNAPAGDRSNVYVSVDLADAGEKPRVVGTYIRVRVAP